MKEITEASASVGLLLATALECTNSLEQFKNNKTPGSDGFTIEFYRFSGMPLVKSWLIALTMLSKMVTCQSLKNAVLYR